MPNYPFIKYSFTSIFRNGRRTLFSIIGIILAVSLIAGESISIDTSVSSLIREQLDLVPYDFSGSSDNPSNITVAQIRDIDARVRKVENVADVCTLAVTGNYDGFRGMGYTITCLDQIAPSLPKALQIKGEIIIGGRNATVTRDFAREYNISVDSYFDVSDSIGNNRTYHILSIVDADENYLSMGPEPGIGLRYPCIYISATDAQSAGFLDSALLESFVWADRSKVIDTSSVDNTNFNLKRLERNINVATQDTGIVYTYNPAVPYVISSIGMMISFIRLLYIALSIPVIILGVYLAALGADLSYAERRREIGILKSRGASDYSIFMLLIGETVFLGIIAGIVGLLLGALISGALSYSSGGLTSLQPSSSLVGFSISTFSIGLSIIFAIVLTLIAHYRPARRASQMVVREAIQAYSTEEAKLKYKPTVDIIFIIIAALTYAGMIGVTQTSRQANGDFGVIIGLLCLSLILLLLMPFAPFFLIIGVSRLATRSSPKVYEATANVLKPILKELHPILKKNVRRNPKRASSVCMLISIALSFGLFVSVTYESQAAYDRNVVLSEVGSDVKVHSVYGGKGGTWDIGLRGNESKVPSIERWTESFVYYASSTYVTGDFELASLDGTIYTDVVNPPSSCFVSGDRGVLQTLGQSNGAIVTKDFSINEGYGVGDTLSLDIGGNKTTYTVRAIVNYLPGFAQSYTGTFSTVWVDKSTLPPGAPALSWTLFLDISAGQVTTAVKYLRDGYGSSASYILVADEELARTTSDPLSGAIYRFLNTEYIFALIIIAIGVTMIMFMAVMERRNEIANMVARGASFRNTMALVSGEGLVISLVGLIIGLFTGLLTAFVFNEMFGMFISSSLVVRREFVFSWGSLQIVLLTTAVLLASSVLVSLSVKWLKLNEILRWRGG